MKNIIKLCCLSLIAIAITACSENNQSIDEVLQGSGSEITPRNLSIDIPELKHHLIYGDRVFPEDGCYYTCSDVSLAICHWGMTVDGSQQSNYVQFDAQITNNTLGFAFEDAPINGTGSSVVISTLIDIPLEASEYINNGIITLLPGVYPIEVSAEYPYGRVVADVINIPGVIPGFDTDLGPLDYYIPEIYYSYNFIHEEHIYHSGSFLGYLLKWKYGANIYSPDGWIPDYTFDVEMREVPCWGWGDYQDAFENSTIDVAVTDIVRFDEATWTYSLLVNGLGLEEGKCYVLKITSSNGTVAYRGFYG